MDETEITNSKYKAVRILGSRLHYRERLADPAFGGNEEFKIEEDPEGNPITPHLNWSKAPFPGAILHIKTNSARLKAYRTNPITGVRELDGEQLNYRYEVYKSTRKPPDDATGPIPAAQEYNTDHPAPTDVPYDMQKTIPPG